MALDVVGWLPVALDVVGWLPVALDAVVVVWSGHLREEKELEVVVG